MAEGARAARASAGRGGLHDRQKLCSTRGRALPARRTTAAAIFKPMRGRLSSHKLVCLLEFFELPKTVSGKIRRVELRLRESALAERGERAEAEFRIEDFPETKKNRPRLGGAGPHSQGCGTLASARGQRAVTCRG